MMIPLPRKPTAGVVAAGDPQTAAAGAALLRAGGNAVDAAVAAALAAFVCELPLASPMGGGVMVRRGPSGELDALDFFGRTPGLGLGRRPPLDFAHVEVDFGATTQVFHIGRGSAAVPLGLPGLLEAHTRWGRLPLREVAEPAVDLARNGYRLSDQVGFIFTLLDPIVRWHPETQALFSTSAGIGRAGDRLENTALATVLQDIAAHPDRVLDLYAQLAREFGPGAGGLITPADIGALEVGVHAPVVVPHRGWTLATMPGPSTGGPLVALGLKLLDGVAEHDFLSHAHLLALVDVQRRLLAVRDAHFDENVRDPAFVERLLAGAAGLDAAPSPSPSSELGSTTHISALDAHGGAVSVTLTNGEGCGHVLAGTGVQVNNLLGEEDINPRGFHVDAPGRAMTTMMAPTIGFDAIGESMALGSGGSNRLRNAILLTLSHLLDHGTSPEAAVTAPRLHLEKGRLAFEGEGLGPEVLDALARRSDAVPFPGRNMYFGGVHLATGLHGRFGGAGDPRRGGHVEVVE